MSKLDRLIQELTIQKQLFFGSLGVVFGIVAWVVTNYKTTSSWVLSLCFIVVLGAMVFGYAKHKRMNQLLEGIENVE